MRTSVKHDEKDIYELLNYADTDENIYDDFQLDETTSKRIKQRIDKKLFKKKKLINYGTAAILLISIGTFSINNSTFASVVQKSIIETYQSLRGNHVNYAKYSSNVNLSAYDKGVTFTVKEIVCDDNELFIAYSIISDDKLTDLIQYPRDILATFKVDGESIPSDNFGNGKFINDNQYDGLIHLNIMRSNLSDIFYLDLDISALDMLKGSWKFNMQVNKEEVHKATKTYELNKTITLGKEPLTIKRINSSPLSTSIEIEITKFFKFYFFLFDDKGNMIRETSTSRNELSSELHFKAFLHDDIKSLTLLPFSCNDDFVANPRLYDMNSLPLELSQGELGKLVVKKFEWEDDTLKVFYTAEGKIPLIQSEYLGLYDSQGNFLKNKSSYIQVSPENQHDFVMCFKGVSKNKKYKIGTSRIEEFYQLDEASKVTIDLK
ncbi:DUF4179 domain-containing protein [Clostridium cellulovorans]|uniref:DUF4179 domain-containing protein n=1 Tax=Clostridium cellulovorans (strain ATCC 35296 / DSM 3052 / OCM 3 / 743B) TaxID=573061 RepID=D9SU33_CLOC7|nr:DUF4179 domain-containing protein [Clostridium cellulovorans]ADL50871.1 hypothetical protein Clocel_1112 [Clostridium cellulovorans 743B]